MATMHAELTDNLPLFALEFLEHSADPVFIYKPLLSEVESDQQIIDFQVYYANRKAVASGIQSGQLLSQQTFVAFSAETSLQARCFHHFQHVYQRGEKNCFLFLGSTADRQSVLECTPTQDGLLIVMREVGNNEVLIKEDEPEAAILQTTDVGFITLKAVFTSGEISDFIIGSANQSFCNLVERDVSFIGWPYSALLPETPELFQLKCEVLLTEKSASYKYYYRNQDKSKWLLVTISKLNGGTLLATFTDVTDIIHQEEEKRQNYDKRLRVFFDTAHAGMYTLAPVRDEQGAIIDFRFGLVNQSVASYLGLQAEELVGSLGSLYFPAYKSNGLFDRYIETMKTGRPSTFDLHYTDGYDNFFTISVVKIGDELFGTFTDHSPVKRLQRQLESSIAELKRSNASLEQFAHAASHDLQEPLRKISMYANKLAANHGDELTDAAFGHVERIKTSCKRMQRLIQDLLVFAEVGSNRSVWEEIELNSLLKEVVNDLEVAVTEKDALIKIGDLGRIKGDSLHLQQLFQNLIGNSIKYSRHDVQPCIEITSHLLRGHDTGLSLSESENESDYRMIQLKDNGQGFDHEQALQIFQIFQRLPQHRTDYSGTGIGLAIVQRVVENHRGYIKAEGVPGEGATFRIYLPVQP